MKEKTQKLLGRAVEFFENGQINKAEESLTKILSIDKHCLPALEILGLIKSLSASHYEAIMYFKRGLKLDPKNFSIQFNLAKSYENVGDYLQAESHYRNLVNLDSCNPNTWINFGRIEAFLNKNDEALLAFEKVISIDSSIEMGWLNKAIILSRLNKTKDAISAFDEALKINHKNSEVFLLKGILYIELKQYQEALVCFNRALELKPDYPEAWSNKGLSLINLKQHEKALVCFNRALELKPNYEKAWAYMGLVFKNNKNYSMAIDCFNKALELNPNYAQAWSYIGVAYSELKENDHAIHAYEMALSISNNLAEAHNNFAHLLLENFNFSKGWEEYEWRWKALNIVPQLSQTPNPTIGENTRLLIFSEQGIGDQILYSSMLNDVSKYSKKVTALIEKKLLTVFKRSFPQINFLSNHEKLDIQKYDSIIALGSLGRFYRNNLNDFRNAKYPYLLIDNNLNSAIKYQLPANQKMLVGLSWFSSNIKIGNDKSIPLDHLISSISNADIDFINLQYGDVSEDIAKTKVFSNKFIHQIGNLNLYEDLDSLLTLIEACHLVITTSNTTAHLAGAVGKETILLLPRSVGKLWYWHEIDGKNLWYPSIKILRQDIDGDWSGPLSRLNLYLKDRIGK